MSILTPRLRRSAFWLLPLLLVACSDPSEGPVAPVDVPTADSPPDDARVVADVASQDAVAPDAVAPDAVAPDAVAPDAVAPDAVAPDASVVDDARVDAVAPDVALDAARPDAAVPDASVADAARVDATTQDTAVDAASGDAATDGGPMLVPVRYADVPDTLPTCALAPGDPRREVQETRCDGLDNDCDGRVDFLLPTGPNACTTTALGVCGAGWATCEGSTRVCQTPAPTPEARDGLDNDCNGVVDDVPAVTGIRPRALMLIPDDLWTDGADEIDTVASIFEQWGIPYDRPAPQASRAAQLATIPGRYALVIVPGYIGDYEFDATTRAALEAFVRQGGVVVVQKPVVTTMGTELLGFLGLTRSVRSVSVTDVRITGAAALTRTLDSPEERLLRITDNTTTQPSEVFVFEPAAGTTVLARALAGSADVGATITRRPLGRGAVYALGHNFHTYPHYRCYINCFEPSGDVLGLMLRDALREGASGHVVLKHTVPGAQDSLLLLTHDVDAPDSALPGSWGAAGAAQMAVVEHLHRARGTYYITTDYVNNYWSPATVRYLCALGMCPPGAHAVTHRDLRRAATGTCTETFATYNPVTESATRVCGEVRVPLELLEGVTGLRPRAWRSPYLSIASGLFDVLANAGITSDSSYAIGDFKTNLPISLARTGINSAVFRRRAMFEHLISIEDGEGAIVNGGTVREELQPSNFARFLSGWTYTALRNAANGAHAVALIHPSWGVNVPETNQGVKFTAADRLLTMAERAGMRTDLTMQEVSDFWRAREGVTLDATYSTTTGYEGSVTVGDVPVSNFTLEFGDTVTTFACSACGPFTVSGRRVVLRGPISARTRATFTAR